MLSRRSVPPHTLMRKTTLLLNIPLAIAYLWENVVSFLIYFKALSLVWRDFSNDLRFSCNCNPRSRSAVELYCFTAPIVTVRLKLFSLLFWLVITNMGSIETHCIGIQLDPLGSIGIHWDQLGCIGIHYDPSRSIGIHWDSLGYNVIQLHSLGYIGLHWDTLGSIGIHWDPLGHLESIGINWDPVVSIWDPLRPFGNDHNSLGYIVIHWDPLQSIGIPWDP